MGIEIDYHTSFKLGITSHILTTLVSSSYRPRPYTRYGQLPVSGASIVSSLNTNLYVVLLQKETIGVFDTALATFRNSSYFKQKNNIILKISIRNLFKQYVYKSVKTCLMHELCRNNYNEKKVVGSKRIIATLLICNVLV